MAFISIIDPQTVTMIVTTRRIWWKVRSTSGDMIFSVGKGAKVLVKV